jgi:hypothetical protein
MSDVEAQLNQTVDELNARIALLSEKNDTLINTLRALGMFERSYVLANATMQQRQRYHELARHIQAEEFAARTALGAEYLRSAALDPATEALEVSRNDGLATLDLSGHALVGAAIAEARAFFYLAGAARFPEQGQP